MSALTLNEVQLPSAKVARYYRGGEGPTLVWLHAANGITENDPVVNALSMRFDVIAPVAPGFIELGELDEIRDVHDLAMFYDDLLELLQLDAVPVAGHSFGGMVAAELAAHYPKRVSRLGLIAPVGLWSDAHPMVDLFAIPPVEINDYIWGDPSSPMAQMAAAASLDAANANFDDEAVVDALVNVVRGMTAVAKFMWPLPDKGLSRRLYRITMPALIVWGAKDRLVPPEYADDFAKAIPSKPKVKLYDDAGHMVTVERLDEVVAELAAFVGR